MAQNTTLFIDDQAPDVQYLCPSLNQVVKGAYYNCTWSTVKKEDCSQGWFTYSFTGTGIRVAASVPQGHRTYSVRLDDGPFEVQNGDGSFTSNGLKDGKHTLTYAVGPGSSTKPPVFDYLTVIASPSTPMNGRTVVVDDHDNSISYGGDWSTSRPAQLPSGFSNALYKDTAHWTSSIGSTLQYKFTGSSISVYGMVANLTAPGNITASYSLDGTTSSHTVSKDTFQLLPMVKFFHADVPAGDHTLIVNITDIAAPHSLGFDMLTYNASFNNILPSSSNIAAAESPAWGPKVAGAIGAVAGAALLISSGMVFWRRRNQKRAKASRSTLND